MENISYAKRDAFRLQLMQAAKAGEHVYENTLNRLNHVPLARKGKKQFTIKEIFLRYWDIFLAIHKGRPIRPAILDNVWRMMHCRDFSLGYVFYECPECDNFHISGLSCHSRFCVSCGTRYRERRAVEIAKKCLNVPHRQLVFTVPDVLRAYFRLYRGLYDILFLAVKDVFDYLAQGKSRIAKQDGREFGYISFLHTFGRDLKHNPHIHVLVAERLIDKDLKMKRFDYFHFDSLRQSFMNQLLKRMYHYLKDHVNKHELIIFSKLRNALYKTYKKGFYTHGPKLKNQTRVGVKHITGYIARYAGHPAISESRIVDVDYDKDTVTYYYDPHEDDTTDDPEKKRGRQFVTESVFTFIKKLIIHIPDKNLHTIRYYGFYANKSKKKFPGHYKLHTKTSIQKASKRLRWRFSLIHTYHYDPLLCECGHIMNINYDLSYFPNTHIGGD